MGGPSQEQARLSASVHIAAQMVLAPKPETHLRPPRPESETPEPRGPESLYYDTSKWTDSVRTRIREKSIERIERGWAIRSSSFEERDRRRAESSSGRSSCATESPMKSRPGSSRPGSFESDDSVATQPAVPKVYRLQPRVCVMCDHCWRAKIPESRSFMLKCPNCLSDQPGEDYLTAAELRDQAAKCEAAFAVRDAAAAKRRKEAMVERARLRMYDQPWTPQLASQHDSDLKRAFEREQADFRE